MKAPRVYVGPVRLTGLYTSDSPELDAIVGKPVADAMRAHAAERGKRQRLVAADFVKKTFTFRSDTE